MSVERGEGGVERACLLCSTGDPGPEGNVGLSPGPYRVRFKGPCQRWRAGRSRKTRAARPLSRVARPPCPIPGLPHSLPALGAQSPAFRTFSPLSALRSPALRSTSRLSAQDPRSSASPLRSRRSDPALGAATPYGL